MDQKKTNVLDVLDEALLKRETERNEDGYRKTHHYVTDFLIIKDGKIEGKCLRANFYEWYNFDKTNVDPKSLYNFATGNALEDFFGDVYERYSNWSVERQRVIYIQPEGMIHPIKGKIDYILRNPEEMNGNHPYTIIIECKTTHGKAMTNKGFGMKYTGPKTGYVMQASTYKNYCDTTPELWLKICQDELDAFNQKLGENMEYEFSLQEKYRIHYLQTQVNRPPLVQPDEVTIIALSREDFYRMQWRLDDDVPSLPMNDFRGFKTLEKYLVAKQLPPKTFKEGPKKYPCSYCNYRDRCYGIDG